MITISIPMEFKPWLVASDEKDIRPVLASICIDPAGIVVATNRHALVACKCEVKDAPADWAGVLIPAAWMQKVHRAALKGTHHLTLLVSGDTVCALTKDGKMEALLTEGIFPGWKQIVKQSHRDIADGKKLKNGQLGINIHLMAKAAEAIGKKDTGVHHEWTEADRPVILYAHDAFALVMPYDKSRIDEQTSFFQGVLDGTPEMVKAA